MASHRPPERRVAPRVSSRVHPTVPGHVNFAAGMIEGHGLILDISATGAHVYMASHRLGLGTRVDLYFLQARTERQLHAIAEVVRETESGFAVRFLKVERKLRSLVLSAVKEEKTPEE